MRLPADSDTGGGWRPARGRDWIEDVEWLLASGVTDAEVIARRTGRPNADACYRALYRAARQDLIRRLTGDRRSKNREQVAS